MENTILEKTLKKKFYRKEYYEKNRERIIKKLSEYNKRKKEELKNYHGEYMRDNRPISFTWSSIKNWRLHPKFFSEEKMFTYQDIKYIGKMNKKD